jgi:plastocyanin
VPPSVSVTISGFSFQPAEATIAKGGTVTWTNDDSTAHTVKFAGSESDALGKGGTYSRTFDSPGTYDYSCGIHPGMKGKVTVI